MNNRKKKTKKIWDLEEQIKIKKEEIQKLDTSLSTGKENIKKLEDNLKTLKNKLNEEREKLKRILNTHMGIIKELCQSNKNVLSPMETAVKAFLNNSQLSGAKNSFESSLSILENKCKSMKANDLDTIKNAANSLSETNNKRIAFFNTLEGQYRGAKDLSIKGESTEESLKKQNAYNKFYEILQNTNFNKTADINQIRNQLKALDDAQKQIEIIEG